MNVTSSQRLCKKAKASRARDVAAACRVLHQRLHADPVRAPTTWVPQRSVGTRIRVARLEPTLAAMSPVISPIMESLGTSAMGAMRISAFCAAQRTAFFRRCAALPPLSMAAVAMALVPAEELRALRQEGQKGRNDGAADAAALSVQDDNGHMKASVV